MSVLVYACLQFLIFSKTTPILEIPFQRKVDIHIPLSNTSQNDLEKSRGRVVE